MTFYSPSRKGPILGIVMLLVIGFAGTGIFFSFRECGSTGIMRNGKSSDATELFQVFPVEMDGAYYFLSLEGVFITRQYERTGGITQRSGFTDIRLTLRDFKTGAQINREVLGDSYDARTRILGVGNNTIWLYNKQEGIHGKSLKDFTTLVTRETIQNRNSSLSEGLAQADDYLGNLEELYAFNTSSNTLMVTTITGKRVFIDAGTFANKEDFETTGKQEDLDDIINEITEQAKLGNTPDLKKLYENVISSASNFQSSSHDQHKSNTVFGADSCTYTFDGKSVRTIIKSNCIKPATISANSNAGKTYIEPVFLSDYNTETKSYTNPTFLNSEHAFVLHPNKIGKNPDLMLSYVNTKTTMPEYTIKTGITLYDYKSSFTISGVYNLGDTLIVGINDDLLSINSKTGKIYWKTKISKNDYNGELFYLGFAEQNGKQYFLTVDSYYTKLSQSGIYINARTDYKFRVIDAKTGKELKTLESVRDDVKTLPYYLGMSNGKCWFYSQSDAIHSRSIPDLKITSKSFAQQLTSAGVKSPLVITTGYSDAVMDKFVGMDIEHNTFFVTTQNGLHYGCNLTTGNITEVNAPEEKNYSDWMTNNPYVSFYGTRLQSAYHNDLYLTDGRKLSLEVNNSVATIQIIAKKTNAEPDATSLKTNQFIDGEFLTNGISINNTIPFTDGKNTPLTVNPTEPTLYILHHDKISPEAHQIISKYNYVAETLSWTLDITEALGIKSEIERIYTKDDIIYFIFNTKPDLDDNFVCLAVNANTGKINMQFKF